MNKIVLFFSMILTGIGPLFAEDRVAFVTGGSSGIGAATIRKFVQENIKVGFLDVDRVLGMELASSFPPNCVLYIEGDVSKVSDIRRAIENTVESFGHLDIVFANAGIHDMKNLLETTEDDWHNLININLKGVVFTVKEALPYLIENGGGSVVLMGSDQCFIGKKNSCAYGMSKGAIGQFTKSTAIEFGSQNIRVNAVCPATIRTPLTEKLFAKIAQENQLDIEQAWESEANNYLLKKCGSAEEVANLVYFLASKEASFITGSLYSIDGGLTAY